MKQLLVVVVLIWHICVNENYSFTKADNILFTFNLNEKGDVSLSCNTFSRIRIVDIYIGKESVPYNDTKCKLNAADIAYIHRTCNGRNECILGMEWSTSCILEYGYYNVSYKCSETCNFEESQCELDTTSTNEPQWRRVKGSEIPSIIEDLTLPLPDHSMNTNNAHIVTGRLSTGGSVTLAQCPSFFLNNLNVDLMYDQSSPVCQDDNNITQIIEEYCATYYRWTLCTFNLENITNDNRCLQPEKQLTILHQCLAETSTVISTPTQDSVETWTVISTSIQDSAETSTVISTSIQDSAGNPMYTIIIVSVLVIVLTSLGVIIVVCYRRKNAKHEQPIGTRQEETANDMTDSTDYTAINYNEMKDIDISKINENRKNKITTHRDLQGNKASAEKEENNCNKYESLATIRNSREHIYESGCAHDNQYQSLTNQRELDEHSYESTEHALAQYQSLTNRSENDNHTYESTSLQTGVLQNKK